MDMLLTSARIAIITMVICVAGYAAAVLGIARIVPDSAEGSLLRAPGGKVHGSLLIAQEFTQPRYFWPRPSAVDYNAAAAGGSNKSPTSLDLTQRARDLIARFGASAENPLPAGLAAASGGGLDPHITEHAALYQAGRVAQARFLPRQTVEALVRQHARSPGGPLTSGRLVNVLELNLALDAIRQD